MTAIDPTTPGARTEADVDVRVVYPYLEALGVQPDQVRAQHTFSIRLGRNTYRIDAGAARVADGAVASGRLDYLVVNADHEPLFIVELKGPREELTEDDRDQGVSYARLVHPIAPLVLVTNGRESRLYDTVTKELLSAPDHATLVRSSGRLAVDDDIRLRAEALEHFVGYSTQNVAAFSRVQQAARMALVFGEPGRGKYIPELYQSRKVARDAFQAFLDSTSHVFVLGGPSGFGKTNEMCALAAERGAEHIALFFNGSELHGSFADTLVAEFEWFFSQALTAPQLCRRLAQLARASRRPVLIFVDAVDEALDVDGLARELSDLATHLESLGGAVRIVVSAKPEQWHRFARVRGADFALQRAAFRAPAGAATAAARDGQEPPMSVVLGPLDSEEHEAARSAYTLHFGVTGTWSYAMREATRDPFLLRIVCEVATRGVLPTDPAERELVREYVDQILRRTGDEALARRELAAVARALVTHGERERQDPERHQSARRSRKPAWVRLEPADVAVSGTGARAAARLAATAPLADPLVAYGLLLRARDAEGRERLRFAYDRVRDYAVATLGLELDRQASREAFRDAALDALASPAGAAALQWYLPYATPAQWEGFLQVADRRVSQMLDAYEAFRALLASEVRAAVDPRTTGDIGVVYAVSPKGSSIALFRRDGSDLPRVVRDDATFAEIWRSNDGRERGIPLVPHARRGNAAGGGGMPFITEPVEYAAERGLVELAHAVDRGRLPDHADEYLIAERIIALANDQESKLGLRRVRRSHWTSSAQRLFGFDLYPLDLDAFAPQLQRALALEVFEDEEIRRLGDEQRQSARQAGRPVGMVSVSIEWTEDRLRPLRERADREVLGGATFHGRNDDSPLDLLASAVELLRARGRRSLDTPLLPPPDRMVEGHDRPVEAEYSDSQLARLIEEIVTRARDAFVRLRDASFVPTLSALLAAPPPLLGIACYRAPLAEERGQTVAAFVNLGPAEPLDGAILRGAAAAVVVSGESHNAPENNVRQGEAHAPVGTGSAEVGRDGAAPVIERAGDDPFQFVLRNAHGQILMRFRMQTGLDHFLLPDNAPRFRSFNTDSAGRHAPVRARAYAHMRDALESVRVEDVVALIAPGSTSTV